MSMISLMNTAYPKVIYNGRSVPYWDNRVGEAIRVEGVPENMDQVARVLEGRGLPPQVHEYIDAAINYTRDFMGAPDAAMGDVKPNNTSAIIAVQRAASVPLELTRQNLYQKIEDLARILVDFMGAHYGARMVTVRVPNEPLAMGEGRPERIRIPFDYSRMRDVAFSLKLDVGAASYWSEISAMTTLDNLFASGNLELTDYLERLPNGMLPKRQELIDTIRRKMAQAAMMAQTGGPGAAGGDGPPMQGPGPPGMPPEGPPGTPRLGAPETPGQMNRPLAYLDRLTLNDKL